MLEPKESAILCETKENANLERSIDTAMIQLMSRARAEKAAESGGLDKSQGIPKTPPVSAAAKKKAKKQKEAERAAAVKEENHQKTQADQAAAAKRKAEQTAAAQNNKWS